MRCQPYTTVTQSKQWAFTSESTIRHTYSTQTVEGVKNRRENSLLLLNYYVFFDVQILKTL